MIIPEVSVNTWRKLYSAAEKFRKLEPWNFIFDGTLFAVREQATGQTYYCCVLGAPEEMFALFAYRGDEGYESWALTQYDEDEDEDDLDPNLIASQNLLMVEFLNKKDLEYPDVETIKKLGLKIKGSNAHPCFRSMIPSCPPWHVNESEAQALISILHCACLFAVEYEKHPEKVAEGADGVLVYLPNPDSAPDSPVPTIFEKPGPKKEKATPEIEVDAFTLKALKNAKPSEGMTWEVEAFFNLDMISDNYDRPYWLRTVIVAHHESGLVFQINVIEPEADTCEATARNIFETIKKYDKKPSELHIRDAVLSKALAPIAKELGISVKVKKRLPVIMKIKEEMRRNIFP